MVLKAIDELNVNVKLLDLNKFSEYFGYDCKVHGKEAFYLWKELFVPMNKFKLFLEQISNNSESEWTTGVIGKGHGIPMNAYFRGKNWIQVKDSMRGAKYSEFCIKECSFYQNRNCQEGVFSLFLSSNLMLHWSGCKNSSIHFNLNDCDYNQIKSTLIHLLSLI